MTKRGWIALATSLLLVGVGFYAYQRHIGYGAAERSDLLAILPSDASAVAFTDLAELRSAPFLGQLFASAPEPQPDEDYARFLNETGFHYERDLDRVALALKSAEEDSSFFAVADGRFDRQKISALAIKSGTVEKRGGREIFAIPESGAKEIYFTFLGKDRIALTDRRDLSQILSTKKRNDDLLEWRARFERLAGSPIFAVIRRDAAPGEALSSQSAGGFRSPELSSMLDQLPWITFAGKPENDRLRMVVEGECASEDSAGRLADLLNGVLTLAVAGLNDVKTRQRLDPSLREAYLGLLKGAEVSRINRGDTKSVRIVFEITPALLESARRSSLDAPSDAPAKTAPGNAGRSKKGHI
jgi:hypothetical protein